MSKDAYMRPEAMEQLEEDGGSTRHSVWETRARSDPKSIRNKE